MNHGWWLRTASFQESIGKNFFGIVGMTNLKYIIMGGKTEAKLREGHRG